MNQSTQSQGAIVRLVPGGDRRLAHLSDEELLGSTRRLVGASNQLFAQLLLHLAEVESRGIHRTRACASLYTYCIYELRMSEDAAARRSSAARLVKRFPILFHAIDRGELHLTGLLMLGPHLTPENHVDVLARAKFRTKKELAKLIRELSPLPLVPDVMEPLGPELSPALREPTWEEWVTSLCPPVRHLKAGEAPSDWRADFDGGLAAADVAEGARAGSAEPHAAPARRELPPLTAPQQYQMQFTTTEQHARLVERAKTLLARSTPQASLGDLHLQAMQLLVAHLEKQHFGANAPRARRPRAVEAARAAAFACEEPDAAPRQRGASPSVATDPAPRQRGASPSVAIDPAPRQRGRHVPAAVKREVFERDDASCSYVDARGQRCSETRYLELHHVEPFARGGLHVASNLALRCEAHNALAAEEDFGSSLIQSKRHASKHNSRTEEARSCPRDD